MIQVALYGKGDILEKLGWCKKFSGNQSDEEINSDACLSLPQNFDVLTALSSPALDEHKIGPKIKEMDLKPPDNEEFELFTGVMIKDFSLHVRFSMLELVPGRPDYEYGIGYHVQTHNIFFEEKIHKEVEKVAVKKKMGLLKQKVVTMEKQLMSLSDVMGEAYKDNGYSLSVLTREKDNRDKTRYGLRLNCNITGAGGGLFVADKLPHRWSTPEDFLIVLGESCKKLGVLMSDAYTAVGYETAPDYTVFLGDTTSDRAISDLSSEEAGGSTIIDIKYA